MQKDRVSIIIPAFNEARNISSVVNDLRKHCANYKLQIILIDDASHDKTAEIAKKSGVDLVLIHKKNKGKGGAFKTGTSRATGEYIVQFDADGQLKASDIPKLIHELKGGADLVLGARYDFTSLIKSKSAQSNIIGNLFVSMFATLFTGRYIVDVMTGLKGFKKSKVKGIIPKANDFAYEAELVVRASKKKYKISTVRISCRERKSGKSTLSPYKHGVSVIKTIFLTSFSS